MFKGRFDIRMALILSVVSSSLLIVVILLIVEVDVTWSEPLATIPIVQIPSEIRKQELSTSASVPTLAKRSWAPNQDGSLPENSRTFNQKVIELFKTNPNTIIRLIQL